MFEGLVAQEIVSTGTTSTAGETSPEATQTVAETLPETGARQQVAAVPATVTANASGAENQVATHAEKTVAQVISHQISVSKTTQVVVVNTEFSSTMTQRLTQTLKVGNAPPVQAQTSIAQEVGSVQVAYNKLVSKTQTTSTNGGKVVIASSSASVSSASSASSASVSTTSSASSGSTSTATTTTGSGSVKTTSVTDLVAAIDTEFSKYISGSDSGKVTVNLGSVSLGGVLSISSVSVTFDQIGISGGQVTSGSVTIAAGSASLTVGSALTATINTVSGSYSVTTQQFSLTFGQTNIAVSSFVTVDAAGASLTYTRTASTSITVTDGTTPTTKTATLMTLGLSDVTIFAGINGPATSSTAVGVSLEKANVALAVLGATDGQTYYALKATASKISAVGLPEGITLTSTDLDVQVNGGTDGQAVDFTQMSGGKLSVATGVSSSIDLDFASKYLKVSGTVEISLKGFVYIAGSVSIESGASATATLSDSSTTEVSVLTIGASDVTIFAGVNGPSTEADATGVELKDAGFALALMRSSTNTYYGLKSSAGSLSVVGLPDGLTLSATDLDVQVNGGNDGGRVVDFTQFSGGKLAVATGPSSSVDLDFSGKFLRVAGTIELNLKGFVYITGSMAIESGATKTVTLSDGSTVETEVLTIGASKVTIFAGINGPSTTGNATGIELGDAGFALALFTGGGKTYYGLKSSAGSLTALGLPSAVQLSAGDLAVDLNGSNDGSRVIDFTKFDGGGYSVSTGPSTTETIDFSGSLLKVAGTLTMQVTTYISITGSFSFVKAGDEVSIDVGHTAFENAQDVTFTLGTSTSTFFSATGYLSMRFNSSTFTILTSSLTVTSGFKIGTVLEVASPSVALENLNIDRATGAISGVTDADGTVHDPILTIAADSASLFPGSTSVTASLTKLNGTFNLRTYAFSISVDSFHMEVGSVVIADAATVLIGYDPANTDAHQQLISIGAGSIQFPKFGISGNLVGLSIYMDGFYFESLSVAYSGDVKVGTLLLLKDPTVTLTNFGMTFGSSVSVSSSGTLTVTAATVNLSFGSASYSASITNLSISVSLAPDTLGNFTISADKLSLVLGTYVSVTTTKLDINSAPDDGGAYFSVTTATATLTVGSLKLTGSASNFSVINAGGSVKFQAGTDFGISFSATPTDLNLPSWLGFSIQKFALKWVDFSNDPTNFTITLSASISSIQGLPSGVEVSGYLTDAVIDVNKLLNGEFPITSITAFGGSVKGELFGMEVEAGFILGVVSFNAEYQVVNADGSVTYVNNKGKTVTETAQDNPSIDTTITGSSMYVGVMGGATIPGVGGVKIYLGFSSLGPLTVYLAAEFPLLIEPNTGLAIGGFAAGVSFAETLPAPATPTALRSATYGTPDSVDITQWGAELKAQTVLMYSASGGGKDMTAAYSQPLVIRASVTVYDAYLSQDAFKITGSIAICINPSDPGNIAMLITGDCTFGDSINFKAYMYIGLSVNGTSTTGQVTVLVDMPAEVPILSYGGTLKFGFTDSAGNIINPGAVETTTNQDGTTTYKTPDTSTIGGFYLSIDGFAQFSAAGTLVVKISGTVMLTVTTTMAKIDLSGVLNVNYLGDIAQSTGEIVVDYAKITAGKATLPDVYGALTISTASGMAKLEEAGLYIDGKATFILNTTGADQTVYLPDVAHPHDPTKATAYAISKDLIFDIMLTGTTSGTYATCNLKEGGQTLVAMEGAFDLRINSDGLTMYAAVNRLSIGVGSLSLTFSGYGLFVVNSQGVAAELLIQYGISSDPESASSTSKTSGTFSGITLNATFMLTFNTTGTDVVYTIPDDLPSLPGADATTRSITIHSGPPQADGTYGASGPYLVITGSGDLAVASLAMHGYFRFEISESGGAVTVSLVVSMNLDSTISGISANASLFGAFQIKDDGLVAMLVVNAGAGTDTDYGPSVKVTINAQLAINTTSNNVDKIGGVTLPDVVLANSFKVEGAGTITLNIGGNTGFQISGTISISVASGVTTFVVAGSLTATVDNKVLLNMGVQGGLVVDASNNAAGSLTLTVNGSNPLVGSGFGFEGTFTLMFNTSGVTQSYAYKDADNNTVNVTVAGGSDGSATGSSYAEVKAVGTMTFGTASTGFLLKDGNFYLVISSSGLGVSAGATLQVFAGGTKLLDITATAAMVVNSKGIAGSLSVSTSLTDGQYYYLGGTFTLAFNTTGSSQVVNSVTISAGPQGSITGAAYFEIAVTGAVLNLGSSSSNTSTALYMQGSFYLGIGTAGLTLTATATLYMKVAGTTLFSFGATGALLISSSGIAAQITLTLSVGGSGSQFAFQSGVVFTLKVNSTASAISSINGVAVSLDAGPYFEVDASGKLALASIVNISGSFTLRVGTLSDGSTGVEITFNATANIMGAYFKLSGAAGIYADGIVINLGLQISSGTAIKLLSNLITIQGTFTLQINSTGSDRLGVSKGTAFDLNISGASLYIFGFKMTGALDIKIQNGVFYATGTLRLNFFGFANLTIDFYFDSTGTYWFYGRLYMQLGSNSFNLHGYVTVMFSNVNTWDSYSNIPITKGFTLHIGGGATAFGYEFASIDAGISINGNSVDVSVRVSVDLWLFTIHFTISIHLGSLADTPAVPVPKLGTVSNGNLALNIGSRASLRGVDALADETYEITVKKTYSDGSQDLLVSAPGIYNGTVEYDGVKSITVPSTGTGNLSLNLASGVSVPVSMTLGSGTNLIYCGAGRATITGTSGTDTIYGGSGGVNFTAGTGTTQFIGGAGANTIVGRGATTVIESGYGSYNLTGGSAGGFAPLASGSSVLVYGAGYTDTMSGTYTLKLIAASTGAVSFVVSNYSNTLSIDGNGNSSVSTSITLDGDLTVNGNQIAESNGGLITLTSINTLTLNGGASVNTFTVNSWSGSGAVTLDGKDSGDTYKLNFVGSGSYTAVVADTGANGVDSLIANGTGNNDTIVVTGSSVSRGSELMNYSGVEAITLNGFAGADTFTLNGVQAATTVNAGTGSSNLNVQAVGGTVVFNAGTGSSTVNLGSLAPLAGGTLNSIKSLVTVNGAGSVTMNVDDTGDITANTGTLTGGTLTGFFGSGGSLAYNNVTTLNLNLGSGGNTLTVSGSAGVTNINSGTGADNITINASTGTLNLATGTGVDTVYVGGVLSNIKGVLTITGSGDDTLNVDNSGVGSAVVGALSSSVVSGLGLSNSGIQYAGLSALNVTLGAGADTFTINSTNAATVTTLNSGDGADTVVLVGNAGTTNINTQGGDDTIQVRSTTGVTTINTGSGTNTVNVGSLAGAVGGVVDQIQGALIVVGSGTDTLNVDDTGSVAGKAGVLTSGTLTGLGMVAAGITYSGLAVLNLNLGSGNDTLTINSTSTATTTVAGNGGNDIFNIRGITGGTTIDTGAGSNVINVGSLQPASGGVVSALVGRLTVVGAGASDTLNVDDTGDAGAATVTMTGSTITGLGMGSGIDYTGVETLNVFLGAFNDTVNLQGNTVTTVTTINTGAGVNTINIGSTAGTGTPGTLDQLQGSIFLVGSGADKLNVDDSGSSVAETATLRTNSLTFLVPASMVTFSGIANLYISLSQGDDLLAIVDTFTSSSSSSVVVVDGNGGKDTFSVLDTHAVATLNGNDGNDNFYIFGNSAVINLNGGNGDDSFYIFASLVASQQNLANINGGAAGVTGNSYYSYRQNATVNIDGGSGNDTVYIFGTIANDIITIDGTHVTGAGIDVNFVNCEALVVAGLQGSDTFYIMSVTVPTTIMGEGSLPIFPPGVDPPDLTGGATPSPTTNDTFYVGWQGQYIPGTLSGINNTLTIIGNDGVDTIYVDDSATDSRTGNTFTLTSTTLTSSAMGTSGMLVYDSTSENLNIQAGAGNDSFVINGTGAGSQTTIWAGAGNDSFVVNAPLTTPLALNGDANTYSGDTLVINGADSAESFVITGYSVDGAGATISYNTIEVLTINGLGGNDSFVVNGDSVPTFINGGAGDDAFTVNSNPGQLVLDGGDGNNSVVLNGNAGTLTASGGVGADSFTINGNSGDMVLNGGDGTDTFVINGNAGKLTANGQDGGDSFVVNSLSTPATLNGGAGDDSFTINESLAARLTLDGGAGAANTLTINGTSASEYYGISSTAVTVSLMPVDYTNIAALTVNGNGGNDTFTVISTSAVTAVNGGAGNDTFNVQTISNPTTLNAGSGVNSVAVGSLAPYQGSIVDGIFALLTLIGGGKDSLALDDSASVGAKTGTLTSSSIDGLGMSGRIVYSGVSVLSCSLGDGGNTFTIASTPAQSSVTLTTGSGADTVNVQSTAGMVSIKTEAGNDVINVQSIGGALSVDTGAGANTFNLGSMAPINHGGVTSGIQGDITLIGSGSDLLNVDDSGEILGLTGTLTSSTLSGLGMGGTLTYSGLQTLNVTLGGWADTFTIASTLAETTTNVDAGAGNDILNLRSAAGAVNLATGLGTNTVTLGSLAPGLGGVVDGIAGAVTLVGSGSDILVVDDTGSVSSKSGVLASAQLTGFGMAGGLSYSGVAVLRLGLGAGSDSLSLTGLADGVVATLDGGAGENVLSINVSGDLLPQSLTVLRFNVSGLVVAGNLGGTISLSGAVPLVTIGGSLLSDATLAAGAVSNMTVGGNLLGVLNVTGRLDTLVVHGNAAGRILAGDVGLITVDAAIGNKVLQVIEAGVERQVQALPTAGGTLSSSVIFSVVYDSTGSGASVLGIRITNSNATANRFDLVLACYSSRAAFDLGLVFASGASGVANVTVGGSLLSSVNAAVASYFGSAMPAFSAGVVLPSDNIVGVAVRDILPVNSLHIAGIEGFAFGTIRLASGGKLTVTDSSILGLFMQQIIGKSTKVLLASDTFRINFGETKTVTVFISYTGRARFERVVALTDTLADGAAISALLTFNSVAKGPKYPAITNLSILGDGATVSTDRSLANLVSTGSLQNIVVRGSQGLGNVTAPNILGSIEVLNGGISGTIQTTGIRIDPITGVETQISAALGSRVYNSKGVLTGVTRIYCAKNFTGQIVSRGDLISSVVVKGSFTGTVAVSGNIGVFVPDKTSSQVLFGAITVSGKTSGSILVLGNVYSDITLKGAFSGRIAATANTSSSETLTANARAGILGNLKIASMAAGSAVVSGGQIGDPTLGTRITCGGVKGILAAAGGITLAKSVKVSSSLFFQNCGGASTANGAVIAAILSNSNGVAAFDLNSSGDLLGLATMKARLQALRVVNGALSIAAS
jgi:hypothetical protein